MRTIVVLAVLAACGGKAPDAPEEDDKRPPAQVTCQPVVASTVDDVVEVSGTIAPPPKLDAVLSSPVAGRVGQVAVEEGDHVASGALLAVVEDPALPAGSIEARAQVASAKAAKENADLELVRQQRLVDTGVGARRDLDEARAKVATAAAELDAANARAGLANSQLARRDLRAPHAGTVLHVWKRVGESVDGTAGTPILEVADVTVLELRAQVPPRALVAIKDAMPATIRVLGVDAPAAGKVARVSPAVDPTTLLGTVRITIANVDAAASGSGSGSGSASAALPVGSAATARIVTGSHSGIVVPAEALRRSITGADELVACDKGVARVKPVTVGLRDGAKVEIATGLAAGESIVVDHVLGLDDGQALATSGAAPAKPGAKDDDDKPAGSAKK